MKNLESMFCKSFNSHPHKEDDSINQSMQYAKWLSTHILTRRMTNHSDTFFCFCVLSTHILTRRMTIRNASIWLSLRSFNSHPHKEDDVQYRLSGYRVHLSTHILTRRMTIPVIVIQSGLHFQLTSSQGG